MGGSKVRLAMLVAILLSPPALAYKPKVKDLGCSEQPSPGTRSLCKSIESEMEWQWMGHAVPAPGYAAGRKTVRNAYCKHPVTMASVDDLVVLALGDLSGPAGVLAETARELLQLLGPEVLKRMPEPAREANPRHREKLDDLKRGLESDFERGGTIFTDTEAPYYLLKDGCQGIRGAKIPR